MTLIEWLRRLIARRSGRDETYRHPPGVAGYVYLDRQQRGGRGPEDGVREPRKPAPPAGSGSIAAEPEDG